MAEREFRCEIRTPFREWFSADVTEVVLPAYDGERGILAGHENFVGLLGTGTLKLVRAGDDYWFVISGGIYEVSNSTLRILTEYVEDPRTVNVQASEARRKELETKLATIDFLSPEHTVLAEEVDRVKAQIEGYRRTAVVQ